MADIVVLGAGACGLAPAALLAEAGHDVVGLERDRAELPASGSEAWQDWPRHGVAQFRNPHWLHPGGRAVLESELPAVRNALAEADGLTYDVLNPVPPPIADMAAEPGEERFHTLTGRRPAYYPRGGGPVAGLRISLLGGFQVCVEQKHVFEVRWWLRKARSMIKLLGLALGHRMPRQQIIELLWSELRAEAAANQLRKILPKARRALSPDRADTFRYLVSGDPVALVDDIWVDVPGGRWIGLRSSPVATAFAPGRATGAAPSRRRVHRPAAWATATTRPHTPRSKTA
jgi:hypothetical protein